MGAILVLDDVEDIRTLLKEFLITRGHLPLLFEKTRHAEISLDTLRPDLALLDINLPGEEHGISFAWRFRQAWPDIPIVVMSSELSKWERDDIYDCGADAIVEKPFNLRRLGRMIDRLLEEGRPSKPEGMREG